MWEVHAGLIKPNLQLSRGGFRPNAAPTAPRWAPPRDIRAESIVLILFRYLLRHTPPVKRNVSLSCRVTFELLAQPMHDHTAQIHWKRQGAAFTDKRYSRGHTWCFDGGTVVPASASPHAVREPYSVAAAVDPEEAFVASISSCHMLWFLDFAARAGWVVDDYLDNAVGLMTPNAQGHLWVSRVTLRPLVRFAGERQPDAAEVARLHHAAHAECFIANSVKSDVQIEPIN